jgi:hypothetical protein
MKENDKNSGNSAYTCESLQHIFVETNRSAAGRGKRVTDTWISGFRF